MELPWHCGPQLDDDTGRELRRKAVFEFCKWDTELCSFPIVLNTRAWTEICQFAVTMTRELVEAESILLKQCELHDLLGLPDDLRSIMSRGRNKRATPAGVRLMRFDFHWTTSGWQISEVNTDAASGFIEASSLSRVMQSYFPNLRVCGDPAGTLGKKIAEVAGEHAVIGLMHLSVYREDRQVVLYLAKRLQEIGLQPQLFSPVQLNWRDDVPAIDADWYQGHIDFLYRFLPAEWLIQMPAETGWMRTAWEGGTPVCNPLYAVLTQSKRFPLIWDRLEATLPTLARMLPETRCVSRETRVQSDQWVIKPALGHEGIRIGMAGITTTEDWEEINEGIETTPERWVAQRRFETLPLQTPRGPAYPCLGVYTIDDTVAGVYGRLAPTPLIDDKAWDVVVLLQDA